MLRSPFSHPDPSVRRAAAVLSAGWLITLLLIAAAGWEIARADVIGRFLISPAQAFHQSFQKAIAEEMERNAAEERQAARNRAARQLLLEQQRAAAASASAAQATATPKPVQKRVTRTKPAATAAPQVIYYQQPSSGTSDGGYTFDQKAWDESVARMKAESDARYQEAVRRQEEQAAQNRADNQAWFESEKAKQQAEMEAWKKENGF